MLTGIMFSMIAVSMLLLQLRTRVYPGFSQWILAGFSVGLGFLLLSYRGFLPDFLTIILANTLILSFYMFSTSGFEKFLGVSRGISRFQFAMLIAACAGLIVFTYFFPNVNIRIIIFSISAIVLILLLLNLLLDKVRSLYPLSYQIAILPLILLIIWSFFRTAYTVILESNITNFMESGLVHQYTFIVYAILHLLIMISLILLTFNRMTEDLKSSNQDLKNALDEVKTLRGIIPICSNCKKIRSDEGYYEALEDYLSEHTEANFSHSLCPTCAEELYPEIYSRLKEKGFDFGKSKVKSQTLSD